MRVLGIQTSPNSDGLTAAIAASALEGAQSAGADTELVHLKQLKIESCRQCENGWGRCRREGVCVIEDDFEGVRDKMRTADALVLSTPVYFGDVSEVTKNLLDRLRRCEVHWPGESLVKDTPLLAIAAAGGGGGGGPTCLVAMERYCQVIRLPVFDNIVVTRRSRDYALPAARAAGARLIAWTQEQSS